MDLPAKLQHFALRLSAYGLKVKGSHHGGTEPRRKEQNQKNKKTKNLGCGYNLALKQNLGLLFFPSFNF
jgi:hypothetical protein